MKLHLSLEYKVSLMVGLLLFALLLVIGYTQMNAYRSSLIAEKTDDYRALASMSALVYSPSAGKAELARYNEFTTRFMKADPDISSVVLTDTHGKVLFTNTRLITSPQAGKSIDFRVPTVADWGQRGTITVRFSTRTIDRSLMEMRAILLYTFALALLVGIIGSLLIAKAVTHPLRALMVAANEVARGNMNVKVKKTSTDEAGDLVDTFNGMVKALRFSRERLVEKANTDSLTGLHNHRYFQDHLRAELKRTSRYERPLSVIMLDIDDFKMLNDTHGHPIGDAVLQDVADILVRGARKDIDLVCRYGGEEFAIILPETNAEDALVVAERIRERIAGRAFVGRDGVSMSVTISAGIAEYPVHSGEREGVIMAADLALYQSKSMGKNRTTIFSNNARAGKDGDPYRLYLLVNATELSTVEALAEAVDAKGHRAQESSRAVEDHAVALAKAMGMNKAEQRDVRIASLLRDIGKLGVSDAVLNKTETLSEEEMEMIRTHPVLGHSVVQKSPHLTAMLPGILYHHERWDGTGYPRKLKGEQIPVIARIIAVVDAYHAMTTDRPYSPSKTAKAARAELRAGSGTQFDPTVVTRFIRILEREEAHSRAA